jgi:hypothetical protein
MSQSHEAGKILYAFAILEDLRGHSVALTLINSASGGASRDTASILAAMLEKVQGIMDISGSRDRLRVGMDNGDNATHLVRYVKRLEMISKHKLVMMSGYNAGSLTIEAQKTKKFKATTRRLAYHLLSACMHADF